MKPPHLWSYPLRIGMWNPQTGNHRPNLYFIDFHTFPSTVFALSVEDASHNDFLALVKLAQVRQIQLKIPNTALWEFNVVLLSQRKPPNDVMNALVLVKAELTNLGIEELSTGLEDLILANKLRAEFHQLTYFDSLHVAAARRVGLSLVSSDKICQQLFGNVVAFEEFLKLPK